MASQNHKYAVHKNNNDSNKYQPDPYGKTAVNTIDVYTKIGAQKTLIDKMVEDETYDFAYTQFVDDELVRVHYFNNGAYIFRIDIVTLPSDEHQGDAGVYSNKVPAGDFLGGIALVEQEIPKGSPAGTFVGTLLAIGGVAPIEFTILDDQDAFFEIQSGNLIFTTQAADAETTHSFTVVATDNLGASAANSFVIDIGPPPDIVALSLTSVNIVDGAPIGSVVGSFNVGGGIAPFTFTITGGADAAKFQINGNLLEMASAADIADVQYAVDIEVEDVNGSVFPQSFTIVVQTAFVNTYSLDLTAGGAPHITIPGGLGIDFDWDTPFSLTNWVNRGAASGSHTLMTNVDSSSNNAQGIIAYFDGNANNRILMNLNNAASNQIRTRFTIGSGFLGAWGLQTITYDGSGDASGIKAYWNVTNLVQDTLEDGLNDMSIVNGSDWAIGARVNGSQAANFLCDQSAIWSVELTPAEIAELYNLGDPIDIRLHSQYVGGNLRAYNWEQNALEVRGIGNGTEINTPVYSLSVPT